MRAPMFEFIGGAIPIACAIAVLICGAVRFIQYRRKVTHGEKDAQKAKNEALIVACLGIVLLIMAVNV